MAIEDIDERLKPKDKKDNRDNDNFDSTQGINIPSF
jgi:hypothetical protein